MDMIIQDAFHPDAILSNAFVHKVMVMPDSTLRFMPEDLDKDYHLVQVAPGLILLANHDSGELIFEDALESHTAYGMDAKTLEALRAHRAMTDQLLTLMSPLATRYPLEIPEGAHKVFWAYTL